MRSRSLHRWMVYGVLAAVLFAGLALPAQAAGGTWVAVGSAGFSPGTVALTSLALDQNGTPYVAFADGTNGNKVTVMRYDGSTWVAVGSPGFSAGQENYISLALDQSGTPYVAYMDVANSSKATVMKYNGSAWVAVGSPGFSADIAGYTSLALDGSGTPYVAYEDYSLGGKATVMKYNGSAWVAVGSAGFSAGDASFTSLALNSSGTPYVAYRDFANSNKATVMRYDGSAWVAVGSTGFSAGVASFTSLALDGNGVPYVAYRDLANSSKATVMRYDGSAWVAVGSAGFSAGSVQVTSLAINQNGTPYVAYVDTGNGSKATVMKYNGSAWVAVGSAGFSAGQVDVTSLALTYNGTPYVAYVDAANGGKATLMQFVPDATPPAPVAGTWVPVGSPGFSAGAANNTSLALDGNGTPYVAYQDLANGFRATVMKYDGSAWVTVGSPGFSAGTAYNTSLALDQGGTPYVAFVDTGNGSKATVMKYNGSAWVAVGSPGFSAGTALYTSLALTYNGTPYVAYIDDANGRRVTVMKYDGSAWVPVGSPAFSAGNSLSSSLALNGSGTPYVVYEDGANVGATTVMKYDGSAWGTVGSAGFSGATTLYPSLALNGNGIPYVAYEDGASSGKATVMAYNGSAWVAVGGAGFSPGVVNYTSLALDGSGTPYVAYMDVANSSKATVMQYDGSTWVAVGSAGFSAGQVQYTSLALNQNGIPYIAFEDGANGNKATVMQFVPDTTPPALGINILSGPQASSGGSTYITSATIIRVGVTDAGSGVASCTLTVTAPDNSQSHPTCQAGDNDLTLSGADGSYTLAVAASDVASNPASASQTYVLDNTPPDTSITSGPAALTNSSAASFIFASSEPNSSFQCSLDGGAFAACSSPASYNGLTDGSHSFAVEAGDALGNTDASPATASWTVDTVPPQTSISAGPAALTNQADASFTFASSEPGSSFQCSLDGGAFAACSSPQSYNGLADGSHSFAVQATDAAGNADPNPASYAWTVDTVAPDTTITSGPAAQGNSPDASFSFTSSEPGSSFACSLDGGAFAACSSPATYTGLADGSHTFAVQATDAAGNVDATPAGYAWSIDTVTPATTISSGPANPSNSSSTSFVFASTKPGSTFQCSLDGGAFAPCSSPQTYSGLADGSHTFTVQATDGHGNLDPNPPSYTWTIDTVAPDTTLSDQPPALTNSSSASFTFASSEPGSSFQCQLDGGAFAACSSPQSYNGLADGSHSFAVQAIDAAGNVDATPAGYTWSIDTVAPVVTLSGQPANPTNSSSASFGFTSSEPGSTFQCSLDGAAFAACTSPLSLTGLAQGSHSFVVKATDAAGNTSPGGASYSWTVDTTAPDTTITAGPSNPTGDTTASFSFTSSEANSTFQCSLDNAGFAACSSPQAYSGLAVGSHTFRVQATDAAGNTDPSPATAAWTIQSGYNFSGFLLPLVNPPKVNRVKAGVYVPVRFRLGGYQGMNIFAAGYPQSQPVACAALPSNADVNVSETTTSGRSLLIYNPLLKNYDYLWKTDRNWAGTCRQLIVKFNDGSAPKVAYFRFVK